MTGSALRGLRGSRVTPYAGYAGSALRGFQRRTRLGLDEAVFCGHKTLEQLTAILDQAGERDLSLLLTRLEPAQLTSLPERQRAPGL